MLVTCLKCKKPVFVSSAVVAGGEAVIPCNACNANLVVTAAGAVRLPEEATGPSPEAVEVEAPAMAPKPPAARATPAVDLPPAAPATPEPPAVQASVAVPEPPLEDGRDAWSVPPSTPVLAEDDDPDVRAPTPALGIGSQGRDTSAAGGDGDWTPAPDVAEEEAAGGETTVDMALPAAPDTEPDLVAGPVTNFGAEPESARATPPPPPPDDESQAPVWGAAVTEPDAPQLHGVPPPPEASVGVETPAAEARVEPEAEPGPDSELPEGELPEAELEAELPEAQLEAELPEAQLEPEPPENQAEPRATQIERPFDPNPSPFGGPTEVTGQPAMPPYDSPDDSSDPAPSGAWAGPAWEDPSEEETEPPPDQWQVSSSVDGKPEPRPSGRAGTVPMDQGMFQSEGRRSRVPALLALLVLVTGGGLWITEVVRIPGLPVPTAVRELLGHSDATRAEVASLEPVPEGAEPRPELSIEPVPSPEPTVPEPAAAPVEPVPIEVPDESFEVPDEAFEDSKRKAKRKRKGKRPDDRRETGPEPAVEPERAVAKAKTTLASPPPSPTPPPPPRPAPAKASAPSTNAAAELHYKQGNLYLKERKVNLAIDEYKACLASNPRYGLAYRSLGVAYMLLGREKSAIQAYEKFVKVMPGHRDAGKVQQIIADYYARNP